MDTVATVGSIVATANRSSRVGKMLRGWNCHVALIVGPTTVGIVVAEGTASMVQPAPADARVSFRLSEQTLQMLAERRITPLTGKLKGLIQSTGNIVDRLRFASILTACLQEGSQK
jgi:hypothetical protein